MTPGPTVLVGTDGHRRCSDAIALGALLASTLGAEVELLHAHPHGERAGPLGSGRHEELVREVAEASMRRAREVLGVEAVRMTLAAAGEPAAALHAAAERGRAAAIVVGSSRRGALGRIFPGGVAQRLLSGAPCPVAVAPAGFAARQPLALGPIGCGFDGSAEAWAALRMAASLARRNRGPLRLICVQSHRSAVSADVDRALAATGLGDRATAILRAGEPAPVLAAESEPLDLLVVGSRGHGPIGSVLAGSVAGRLIRTASCPVMVVPRRGHPDGSDA